MSFCIEQRPARCEVTLNDMVVVTDPQNSYHKIFAILTLIRRGSRIRRSDQT